MRQIALVFFVAMAAFRLFAQDITGQWNGLLKVQGSQLRVVFNVNKTDTGYICNMDSPDQGVKGFPASKTTFENTVLRIEFAAGAIRYEGTLTKENKLVGEFRQSTFSAPLTLTRNIQEKEKVIRPQDPVEPYPYYTEEVKFTNTKDATVLAGTLSLPKKEGKFPAVILITGSGAQDRNEELMGHRPFLVLADHLTRNGIAVLRYDDRGTAKSTGDFSKATTAVLATDVEAAISYLLSRKEIDRKKIGLLGHSEGGIIASIVAAGCKDVRCIVLMAGTGIRGSELLLLQQESISRANGQTEDLISKNRSINKGAFDLILNATNEETMNRDLKDYLLQEAGKALANEKPAGISDEDLVRQQVGQLTSPWFQYFLKYNPSLVLQKIKCPVLALNGSKDLQVPARVNLSAIKINLEKGGNKKVTVREYPNLNHLFQECKTGLPNEYGEIQQTISPQVLNEISGWILRQVQ